MIAWVSQSVLRVLAIEAQSRFPNETGGVLMGYWHRSAVVISCCTTSGPDAQHSISRYVPDGRHDEAEIARIYENSGRVHTYLGDWHTHPNEVAYLSPSDRETLFGIAMCKPARNPRPLMAILAGGPDQWEVYVWIYGRRGVKGMTVQPYDDANRF